MAKDETRVLAPGLKTEDTTIFSALQGISDYNPSNPDFAVAVGIDKQNALTKANVLQAQAETNFKAARDNSVAAEWDFHNFILGAKGQVAAQFGPSSNEIQGMGLKKKTEYKSPKKKKADTPV